MNMKRRLTEEIGRNIRVNHKKKETKPFIVEC